MSFLNQFNSISVLFILFYAAVYIGVYGDWHFCSPRRGYRCVGNQSSWMCRSDSCSKQELFMERPLNRLNNLARSFNTGTEGLMSSRCTSRSQVGTTYTTQIHKLDCLTGFEGSLNANAPMFWVLQILQRPNRVYHV